MLISQIIESRFNQLSSPGNKIVQAAFYDTGRRRAIGSGPFHDIDVLYQAGYAPDHIEHLEQGFLTDNGTFLTRKEAARLVAFQKGELNSEDLSGMGRPGFESRPRVRRDLRA